MSSRLVLARLAGACTRSTLCSRFYTCIGRRSFLLDTSSSLAADKHIRDVDVEILAIFLNKSCLLIGDKCLKSIDIDHLIIVKENSADLTELSLSILTSTGIEGAADLL